MSVPEARKEPNGGGGNKPRRRSSCSEEFEDSYECQWLHLDEMDGLPLSLRFNYFDMACIIISIITYVIDLAMDLFLSYVFYKNGYIGYFILTLVFVIIPAGTMTAFSLRWYIVDMDNEMVPKPSCSKWIIRTIFLLLQCSPVLRYLDSLIYGLKSRKAAKEQEKQKQIKYYTYMVNEDADATLLRLFEGFMESAPQVTLQLYIYIYHYNSDEKNPFGFGLSSDGSDAFYRIIPALSITSSMISLAWSLSVYNRSVRYSQPEKKNISYQGTLVQFFWHFCAISARVFALAVFAACYPILIVPVCIAHWLSMLAWLIVQGNQACSTECEEAMFNLVVAFIYIFTFFNIRDEPTRYKYAIFYSVTFLENTFLLFTWFLSEGELSKPEVFWFRVAGLVGDYILFFVGILCMILYYVYFHPTVGHMSKRKKLTEKPIVPRPQIMLDSSSATANKQPPPASAMKGSKTLVRRSSLDHSQLSLSSTSARSAQDGSRRVTFCSSTGVNLDDNLKSSSNSNQLGIDNKSSREHGS